MAVELVTTARVAQGRAGSFLATFYDDESGAVVDPGITTLGIVDASGATVVVSSTATTGTGSTGRTYDLTTTHTANLDWLTVTLTTANYGTFDAMLEVVGHHLFTIREARAYGDGILADQAKYSVDAVADARDRVSDRLENICGVSFIPRYELVEHDGGVYQDERSLFLRKRNGDPALKVSRIRHAAIRSFGTTTWTDLTGTELADLFPLWTGEGLRESTGVWLAGHKNTRVGYEHGFQQTPREVKRAAMMLARYELVPSNLNSRALQEQGEFGTVQLATAGKYGSLTGIPDVDEIIQEYMYKVPVLR